MSERLLNSSRGNSKIFISYRRAESAHAGRLYADLNLHFGDDQVFMDVQGIKGGDDFVRIIEAKLASAKILIAVIGTQWLDAFGKTNHLPRTMPNWVHLEIATALERRIKIIPVLVGGAGMPFGEDLPKELKSLARQQATTIRDDRWDLDFAHLTRILEEEGLVPKRNRVSLVLLGAIALTLIGMLLLVYYSSRSRWLRNRLPTANSASHQRAWAWAN